MNSDNTDWRAIAEQAKADAQKYLIRAQSAASAIDGDYNAGVEAALSILQEISAVFRVKHANSYGEGYVDACDTADMLIRKLKR